jgi:hypothetical protein
MQHQNVSRRSRTLTPSLEESQLTKEIRRIYALKGSGATGSPSAGPDCGELRDSRPVFANAAKPLHSFGKSAHREAHCNMICVQIN